MEGVCDGNQVSAGDDDFYWRKEGGGEMACAGVWESGHLAYYSMLYRFKCVLKNKFFLF